VKTQREESRSNTTLRMSACWLPGVRLPSPEGGELPDDGDDGDEIERTRAAVGGEGDFGRPGGGVVEDAVGRGGELCVDESADVLEGGAYRAATMAAISAASSRSLFVLMERGSPDLSLGGVRMVDVRG